MKAVANFSTKIIIEKKDLVFFYPWGFLVSVPWDESFEAYGPWIFIFKDDRYCLTVSSQIVIVLVFVLVSAFSKDSISVSHYMSQVTQYLSLVIQYLSLVTEPILSISQEPHPIKKNKSHGPHSRNVQTRSTNPNILFVILHFMRTMEGQNTILLVPLILIFIYTISISWAKQATYKFKNENLLEKYLKYKEHGKYWNWKWKR